MITEDNLVVSIDTVIYFQVTDPMAATYEIANYIQAIEQLTMTTLRNIVGGMDLEQTLTSRDQINAGLRGVLDEATGKWGIRVNRVELKGIDPPPSIKDSMEKQMRADRDKRAAILTAEGQRQSAILTAEGEKQSAILTAEGDRESQILRAQADRESAILRAQGEAQAIQTVFQAIHDGQPDQTLLAYQYLQMLPKIAEGDANKVWIVPSEIGKALEGLGSSIDEIAGIPQQTGGVRRPGRHGHDRAAMPAAAARRRAGQRQQGGRRTRSPRREAAIAAAADAANARAGGGASSRTPAITGAIRGDRRPPAAQEPPRAVTPSRSSPILARGAAAGHDQHRRRVGNADHVPDPARVRRPAGDRQRLQHHRAGPGLGRRASSGYRARAARAARAAAAARRRRRCSAGSPARCCCSSLPGERVRRDRAGADRARRACWSSLQPRHLGVGRWPHEASRRRARTTALVGVARSCSATGVYGGYFGAAQGVLLMAVLGIGVDEHAAAAQRRQERPRLRRQRRRRPDLHRRRRRRLGGRRR